MLLAWKWAEKKARQQWEEEDFVKEMANLELKEEEEWRVWEEEENRLQLASKQEKRWLVELAEQ